MSNFVENLNTVITMTRNASSTAPQSRHSSPGRRRISQKAYDRFVARIKDVYSGYIMDPAPMLRALDAYLDGNRGAHYSLPPLAHLAFLVLRQDIDAAIERSRAARERARLRREAKMQAAKKSEANSDGHLTDETTAADDPTPSPQDTPLQNEPRQNESRQDTPLPDEAPSAHTTPPPDAPNVTTPSPKKRIKCHNRHARRVSPRIFMQLDNAPCKR